MDAILSCCILSMAVGPKRSDPLAPIYIALLFSSGSPQRIKFSLAAFQEVVFKGEGGLTFGRFGDI
jgi:hypothetical protein